jgi:hypothetical protein
MDCFELDLKQPRDLLLEIVIAVFGAATPNAIGAAYLAYGVVAIPVEWLEVRR